MALRLIAIGDLHGEVTLLSGLLQNLRLTHEDRLVFLGDYVDRGENSPATIDLLRILATQHHCIFLRGNHEDMMMDHCLNTKRYPAGLWEQNGGAVTLMQYRHGVPYEHLGFLMNTIPLYQLGNMLFVHAGFNPEKPITEQTAHDMIWMREPWLSKGTVKDFDGLVFHGHTPTEDGKPNQVNRRIGLDTMAYKSGILTAAILEENAEPVFVQIAKDDTEAPIKEPAA